MLNPFTQITCPDLIRGGRDPWAGTLSEAFQLDDRLWDRLARICADAGIEDQDEDGYDLPLDDVLTALSQKIDDLKIIRDLMDDPNATIDKNQDDGMRMDAIAYKAAREHLGFTGDELAERLGVNPRTARAWEKGRDPIPYRVPSEIRALLAHTDRAELDLYARLEEEPGSEHGKFVPVWASTEAMHKAGHHRGWPARWWRQIAMRVVTRRGGTIVNAENLPPFAM